MDDQARVDTRTNLGRPVLAWVARQLLEMPTPLRDKLTGARPTALWAKLTGNIDAASHGRGPAGAAAAAGLAPIAVAYEQRMIVGWRLADHLRTDLALDALEMAIWRAATAGGWRGLRRPIAAVSVLWRRDERARRLQSELHD
ncbi:hypothetical protein ACFYOK_30695 [Microbispora bryophytorum]|uniref:hypothetical protein n=1 Tax=Microbispora bryophytorum TaxID=1460882 RepID=UPI0033D33958